MPNKKHGTAYEAVRFVYDHSPGRSWSRLNGALADTLAAAITAHLSFLPDDFRAMHDDMAGAYWMGNSEGSTCGERFYGVAVRAGNTPTCIAFEKYAKRPAALWAENVKTPERLCIGSEFTWEGIVVSVTNMREDHLIACSYQQQSDGPGFGVGCAIYANGEYRNLEDLKRLDNGAMILRLGEIIDSRESRKVAKRFTIKYSELAAVRKGHDSRRKAALKQIADAETPQALTFAMETLAQAPRGFFRHFDIEDIRQAHAEKRNSFREADVHRAELLSEAERLSEWIAGKDVRAWFTEVRLRVRGDYVETSTGQSVSLQSVKEHLPAVMRYRHSDARTRQVFGDPAILGRKVDLYEIKQINSTGVTVGCTLVPWSEVERLDAILKQEVHNAGMGA